MVDVSMEIQRKSDSKCTVGLIESPTDFTYHARACESSNSLTRCSAEEAGCCCQVHSSSMLSKSYVKHVTIRHVYSHDGPHASVLTSAAGCVLTLYASFVQPRPRRLLDLKKSPMELTIRRAKPSARQFFSSTPCRTLGLEGDFQENIDGM